MSCKDCERIQKENTQGYNRAYLRVGAANVLIGACDKHFNELRRGFSVDADSTVHRVAVGVGEDEDRSEQNGGDAR